MAPPPKARVVVLGAGWWTQGWHLPHLHRHATLAESGYTIPTRVVHAAPAVADWIREHVERPVLVGPDSESEQWVSSVAELASAPHIVLEKVRRGDKDVEVSVPEVDRYRDHTPVLVDDIISTARTMVETLRHLARAGMPPTVCVGIHAVFASDGLQALEGAGPAQIVTCDTIEHSTNEIGLAPALAAAVSENCSLEAASLALPAPAAAFAATRGGADFGRSSVRAQRPAAMACCESVP